MSTETDKGGLADENVNKNSESNCVDEANGSEVLKDQDKEFNFILWIL